MSPARYHSGYENFWLPVRIHRFTFYLLISGPSRFETGVPTKLSSPPPVAPVWNHATGEFVMDNSIQSSYKKYEKPPKPQQGNHTGRYSRPPAKSQPLNCPPCPCLNQPSPKPASNEDLHRFVALPKDNIS